MPFLIKHKRPEPAGTDVMDLWSGEAKQVASPLIDMAGVRAFLAKHWFTILAAALLVLGITIGVTHFLFNKYSAAALIMVDPRSAQVTKGQEILPGYGSDAFAIESVVQIARSEGFLNKIVTQLHLAKDPEFGGTRGSASAAIEKLKKRLTISRRGATYVIEVAARSKYPVKSARIANQTAQLIVEDQSRIRSESSENAIAWLATRLQQLQEKLRRSENASASLKSRLKLTDAGQGYTLQERRIAELTRQLVLASTETSRARARRDQLRLSGSGAKSPPSALQSQVLSGLRRELAQQARRSADLLSIFGSRHPEVVRVRAQITDIRKQIESEVANLRRAATNDVREAERREATLAEALRNAQAQSGTMGQDAVRLAELEREAKADRGVYEQLLARYKELSEFRNLKSRDVRIAAAALTPQRVDGPPFSLIAIAGLALGLLSGLGLAAGLERSKGTVTRRQQIERRIGLPIIGVMPWSDVQLEAVGRNNAPAGMASFFDNIATLLQDSQVILVTSAQQGVGKSTVASRLAAVFSSRGSEVLLIEGSVPKEPPKTFQFGLIDVLKSGDLRDNALIGPTAGKYFLMRFGGPRSMDPDKVATLFRGQSFSEMMRRCRKVFDLIIIDGPTMLEASYIAELQDAADLTVQVIAWNDKDQAAVVEACKRTPGAVALLSMAEAEPSLSKTESPDRLAA